MQPKKNSLWTDEELAQLQQLKAEGVSNQEIADRLGRSRTAIKSKLERISVELRNADKIKRAQARRWTLEDDQQLIELKKKQLNHTEIAEEVGRSKNAIDDRCRVLGLSKALGVLTQREVNEILKLHEEGLEVAEIAEKVGRSKSSVYKCINMKPAVRQPSTPRVLKVESTADMASLLDVHDDRLDAEIRVTYQRVLTQATTIEMVLFTLWKTPSRQRTISIEDAAVKLVRLAGHGPDYFHARREWKINDWIKHLEQVSERDMP